MTQEQELRAQMILEGVCVDFSWALDVSHTGYSSCVTKENMFIEDVSTFHLNNLRISGSVSLAGETNRSLGRKYHYQKWGVELTRFLSSTFPSVGGFVSFSVSEIFIRIESCSQMNLRKGSPHQKRWRASELELNLELLIKWWIPFLWGWKDGGSTLYRIVCTAEHHVYLTQPIKNRVSHIFATFVPVLKKLRMLSLKVSELFCTMFGAFLKFS